MYNYNKKKFSFSDGVKGLVERTVAFFTVVLRFCAFEKTARLIGVLLFIWRNHCFHKSYLVCLFAILLWLLVNVCIAYKSNIRWFLQSTLKKIMLTFSPSLSNSHRSHFIFFFKLQVHAQQNVPSSDLSRYFDTNKHLLLIQINSANEHRTLHVFFLFAFFSSSVVIAKSQCCHMFYTF